mgnify:CR=1 FL=1
MSFDTCEMSNTYFVCICFNTYDFFTCFIYSVSYISNFVKCITFNTRKISNYFISIL